MIGIFDEVNSLQNREKPLNNRITKEVKNYAFLTKPGDINQVKLDNPHPSNVFLLIKMGIIFFVIQLFSLG